MTVSGLTMISASRQSFQSLERQTQKRRSRRRSFGRLTARFRMRSCCRRTRISAASESLETNRDRKNRKNAEKMAIKVERSISNNEGDGQKNRIAASSAKCKENMAGWTFYQGQQILAREFNRILKQRDQAAFPGWMERASESRIPEMKSLAAGIERDRAAVTAALAYEWSNGTTEGHINRLKTLKRAMYGRAKFDLLKIKVLAGSKRGAG